MGDGLESVCCAGLPHSQHIRASRRKIESGSSGLDCCFQIRRLAVTHIPFDKDFEELRQVQIEQPGVLGGQFLPGPRAPEFEGFVDRFLIDDIVFHERYRLGWA